MIHWTGDAAGSGSQTHSGEGSAKLLQRYATTSAMPERKVAELRAGLLLATLWSRLADSSEWLRDRAEHHHAALAGGLREFNLGTEEATDAA